MILYHSNKLHQQPRVLFCTTRKRQQENEKCFSSSRHIARDKEQLSRMGISHVVNAAAGRFHLETGPKFYKDLPVDYYGIEAEDSPNFDLSIYFYPVARYIRAALNSPRGKVLVHCAMGISRSATLVLAFLMICEDMSLADAIQAVRSHRGICPNSGFLEQLRELDLRLGREKRARARTY
ncbi:hypothetical protein ASZ78_004616 [Callipepla squamata]|uniref:Dual specificity protein phosphatase n=1 Tax=Callipepla squamata TaxID=9009 RepID=A0A226NHI3_CALSU|nr:hypothetical protein ASZ78_004616 [Callipepla squamata]